MADSYSFHLTEGETLRWQGKPAPRCFVFRNWRYSVYGVLLLIATLIWQSVCLHVARTDGLPWLAWLPLPFILLALYLTAGYLLLARLEWSQVDYAVTDRRLLVRRGLFRPRLRALDLAEVSYFRLHFHGAELGTLQVHGGGRGRGVVLAGIEYPRRVTDLLEAAMGDKAVPVADPEQR
ncbi:MAG: PH domain-containing protein [Desulfuromonadales bacterium]|nr:PH domain-containing protein [Desulfuromonadales bacterium]